MFRRIMTITAAASATDTKTWDVDDNYQLKHILFIDQDGYDLTKFRVTVSIDRDYLTEDEVPASIFGSDYWTAWPLDRSISKAQTLSIAYKNNDSITHTVDVVLVLEKPS